ncbi:GPI ethanolamine phosphate transferase 1 [Adelges cooleyi]|uniref:GPI ethanolamine phosphate transferase 1 n=1 Tax=Adelges cooleyi TaxID=133065 RepID=UPI00217FFDBD|nr:GPI ethanolamine phosphate transferase 1 [Adelges cooleyi]
MVSVKILILGFVAQLSLLISIFDIYFKSPIISGIPDQKVQFEPPADRLVLFVADGLRADIFYDHVNHGSSTLFKNIIDSAASYGICHTRVPTESRPGHIALIAGFYEDPSAIFKGWKDNVVDFDSVFNKSALTLSWGSPDIINIFKKGNVAGNVHVHSYQSDLQDFTGKNGSSALLSEWVFDKIKSFIEYSKIDASIQTMLATKKLIFFLHLLGTDVSGHIDKPHSKEYLDNLVVIENGVKETVELLESFYNDNRTAYIFTSDHGMTDWGSHGDGLPSETEVPIITWGAGLSGAKKQTDSLPLDVRQADVAPLMSTLIGVPIPVNSVGILPLNLFSSNTIKKAKYLLANALQLNAAFSTLREQIEIHTFRQFYVPFEPLGPNVQTEFVQKTKQLVIESKVDKCIELCYDWIHLSLNGIDYYNTYYKWPLLLCVTFIGIGWIILLILETMKITTCNEINRRTKNIINAIFCTATISCSVFIYAQALPLQFHFYTIILSVIWWVCISQILQRLNYANISEIILNLNKADVFEILFYFVGIELLVWTFFERHLLSLALIILCLWMTYSSIKYGFPINKAIIVFISSAWFSICPLTLVIDGQTDIKYVVIGGVVWLLAGIMHLKNQSGIRKTYSFVQVVLLALAIVNVMFVSNSIENKLGLSTLNKILSWSISITSMCVFKKTQDMISNVTSLFLSISAVYVQLSLNMEVIFMLVLTITLACWRKIAIQSEQSSDSLRTQWRHAFYFLLFSFGSFFGMGNIASINSFDPSVGQCFVSVFSPFTTFGLVLFKILTPILLTCCTFYVTSVKLEIPPANVFSLMLAMSNIMGLHFLYFIKNTGSWLDIGMSISHFVIVQSLALFLSLLYGLAGLLIGVDGTRFKQLQGNTLQLIPMVNKNHCE